jgi:hypothetical protein
MKDNLSIMNREAFLEGHFLPSGRTAAALPVCNAARFPELSAESSIASSER